MTIRTTLVSEAENERHEQFARCPNCGMRLFKPLEASGSSKSLIKCRKCGQIVCVELKG